MPIRDSGSGFTPSPGAGSTNWNSTGGGEFPSTLQPTVQPGPDEKSLGQFVTTAYGPPWNAMQGHGVTANGTDLRPARKVYGVAVDPAIIPLGTRLLIWPNPFDYKGTFIAFDTGGAIKGKRIDFYDWRGRASQTKWGKRTAEVNSTSRISAKLTPPKGDPGFLGLTVPNPISAVDDMASAVKDFVQFIMSPKSIGELIASIYAYVLKLIFKAIWKYVIAPVLHWHQRAVLIFYRDTLTEKTGVKGFVTLSFWATGYAILWSKVDGEDKSLVTDPVHTPLGRVLRGFSNTAARRKLVKPKDVQKKTPTKPEPTASTAGLMSEGSTSVRRTRTVKVGREDVRDHTGAGTDTGTSPEGTNGSAAAESAAETVAPEHREPRVDS